MEIQHLTTESFRNLAPNRVEFHPRLNLIVGENGQGKTNLLEAIALLAGRPSFRTHDLRAVARRDGVDAVVSARVSPSRASDERREAIEAGSLGLVVHGRTREHFWNGLKIKQLRSRQILPTVFLTTGDLARLSGAPADRRQALDRIALALDGTHVQSLNAYERARSAKSQLLVRKARFDSDELAVYEENLAMAGARIALGRQRASQLLSEGIRQHATRLSCRFSELRLELKSDFADGPSIEAKAAAFRDLMKRSATQERRAARCLVGSHRDDVVLTAGDIPVSTRASSGETRTLLLAWTLAELYALNSILSAWPVLAFDDFDSEWDEAALYAFAEALPEESQIFLTSARPDALRGLPFPTGASFEMNGGRLRREGILGGGRSEPTVSRRVVSG